MKWGHLPVPKVGVPVPGFEDVQRARHLEEKESQNQAANFSLNRSVLFKGRQGARLNNGHLLKGVAGPALRLRQPKGNRRFRVGSRRPFPNKPASDGCFLFGIEVTQTWEARQRPANQPAKSVKCTWLSQWVQVPSRLLVNKKPCNKCSKVQKELQAPK